ncbi:MAG: head GIN domain-containing protein [Chitinophagaceae bacterium]
MKKLLLLICAGIFIGNTANSQKTFTDPNAEIRGVAGFHGIEVGTGIVLNLTEGVSEEVAVSASSVEFRDKIVTKVENGILKIIYENKAGAVNTKKQSKDLKAYVSYKTLDMLMATTGAEIIINGILQSASLNLIAHTGAVVKGQVNIKSLKIKQGTGSKVTWKGKADNLEVEGDTGSKFEGEELQTTNCSVKVSTGAQVIVSVENELKVKASTGGLVKYKGKAPVREIKTNTGGSVKKIKD